MNAEETFPPIVSIVIPVYNPGEHLREALKSVYAQTFTKWELLLIDDNSSEDLSWIKREFPLARLIRQEHGGASIARNNGILNSSGLYIAFMDQDDMWRPHKLERQVAAFEEYPDAALCYCELEVVRGNVKFDTVPLTNTHDKDARREEPTFRIVLDGTSIRSTKDEVSNLHQSIKFFVSQFIVPSTVMIRRQVLATSGLLDPFIPFTGDFDLLIKLGAKFKLIKADSVDVLYRTHDSNFSWQYLVGRSEVEALGARYIAYAKSKGDKTLAKNVRKLFRRPSSLYASQAFDAARASLRKRERKQFLQHLGRALLYNPCFVMRSLTLWAKRNGAKGKS